MGYRALVDFKDLMDDGYLYKAGDPYPRVGVADETRVKHLMTPTTQRGALIEEVSECTEVKPKRARRNSKEC